MKAEAMISITQYQISMRKQQEVNTLRNIVIKGDFQIEKLMPNQAYKKLLAGLDRHHIWITESQFTEETKEILAKVQTHEAEVFNYENDIKWIIDISFPQLLTFNISGLMIQTLERVPRMFMPQLTAFSIYASDVVSMRPIRKVNFPCLRELTIGGNEFREFGGLADANFQKMEDFTIEGNPFTIADGLEDLSCIFKLNSQKLINIWAVRGNRINQEMLRRTLKQKYLGVSLEYA